LLIIPLTIQAQTSAQILPLPFTSAKECGIVGDKSRDDTEALNTCIANLPDYHVLLFPPAMKMKITGTINIHKKAGIRLVGVTSMFGGPSASTDAPAFFWYGDDNGTMIDIDRSMNFLIEGLALFTSENYGRGDGGAAVGFNVDNTLSGGYTTTNGIFDRVAVIDVLHNSHFVGIQFANVSKTNVEHMTVRDSTLVCSYGTDYKSQTNPAVGIGIKIGGSYNAKKHLYVNNNISDCSRGVQLLNGSADILHNQFQSNVIHVEAYPTDPILIEDNDSENCHQFFKGVMAHGGEISANRIAAVFPASGTGAIQFTGGGGAVVVENNSFDSGSYIPVMGQNTIYGAPALLSRNNRYPDTTKTLQGFSSFGYNAISMQDSTTDGFYILLTKGTAQSTKPLPKFGILSYDDAKQRWTASENGSPYKNLIPSVGPTDPHTCSDSNGSNDIGNIWVDTKTTTSVYKVCLSVRGSVQWVAK
jgi:hypothetical protein